VSTVLLHIRQVVIGTVPSELDVPPISYFRLSSGTVLSATGDSGLLGSTVYWDYALLPNGSKYLVSDIIPQYYSYAGYCLNSGGAPAADHDQPNAQTDKQNGQIELDYNAAGEYWLTVYIQANANQGEHGDSYATNDFDKVN
jgi:hypothetical protein